MTPLMAMLVWLGYINIGLAIFNMLPGFPMDGGRVLRAIIWWRTGSAQRATRVASLTGQIVAFAFIIFGILRFFGGAGFGGLWMTFIGWFLLNAAKAAYAQQELTERLRGVRVAAPPGFEAPTLFELESLRLQIALLPLLRRQLVVRAVDVDAPHLWLEQRADSLWNFAVTSAALGTARPRPGGATAAAGGMDLRIQALHVTNGALHYWSRPTDLELRGPLAATLQLRADRALNRAGPSGH